MKKNRKAFTIVELVIVIAVIAILAAVLIPTFSSLIKKAQVSNDSQLVRNLNTALLTDKAAGNKHETMTDALKAAEKAGYNVSRINASATDNEIMWDSKNDAFCYRVKQEGSEKYTFEYLPEQKLADEPVADIEYWCIADTVSPKYSTYLYMKGEGEHVIDVVNTSKGLDVGNVTVKTVKYQPTGKQTVVIRTDSALTSLDVDDAFEGTINHYGEAGSLNIIRCHTASFHEFGTVAFVEIATGRIVLETSAEVEHIHLNTSVVGNETVFNNITVAKASSVEMPEFSRDPVDIPAGGQLVVALQNGTNKDDGKDYVWLTAVGIYEQVTVSDSSTQAKNNFAATSDTASQEQKTAAQQIANNITTTVGTKEYTLTATPVVENNVVTGWTYSLEGETAEATEEVEDYTVTVANNVVTVKDSDDVVVESTTNVENGIDEQTREEAQKTATGYIARVGSKYYMDAESAFNEASASSNDKTVVILADCKIDIDSIPNEIDVITNGKTIERNKISERYIQLGKLPWSIWDYDLGGYITQKGDVEKWYKVDGSTFPVYRNGWQYPSDREIFDEALNGYSQYTRVERIDIDPVVGEFAGNSTALKYFAGGAGTATNPFVISTSEELGNISSLGLNRKAYYVLNNDITTDNCTLDYNVDFDLNGHTITKTAGNAIFWAYDYLYVHDGNIVLTGDNSSVFGDKTYTCEIHVANVNVSGNVRVTASHYGALIKYLGNTSNDNSKTSKMYVENLTSFVNIKAASASVGGLFGYCLNTSLDLRDIAVYGSIETGNTAGGIVMGDTQVCGYSAIPEHQYMTVSNVKFYGSILVPENKKAYIYGNTLPAKSQDNQDNYKGEGANIVKGINIDNQLIVTEDNEFVINADSQYTTYVVKYQFAVDYIDGSAGGYPRSITKEFTTSSSDTINTGIYKYSLVELEKEEADTLVSDEFNRIFVREGLADTYCYDGQGSFTISSGAVTVYIYAYTGDSLRAIGSYSYQAQ